MVRFGDTFRCNEPPRHIWIVLSDPPKADGRFLFVNLTTLRPTSYDDTCLLGPSDYSLLEHDTTVAYSLSKIGNSAALEAAVMAGNFTRLPSPPNAALNKILDGARRSEDLSLVKKGMLP